MHCLPGEFIFGLIMCFMFLLHDCNLCLMVLLTTITNLYAIDLTISSYLHRIKPGGLNDKPGVKTV